MKCGGKTSRVQLPCRRPSDRSTVAIWPGGGCSVHQRIRADLSLPIRANFADRASRERGRRKRLASHVPNYDHRKTRPEDSPTLKVSY